VGKKRGKRGEGERKGRGGKGEGPAPLLKFLDPPCMDTL